MTPEEVKRLLRQDENNAERLPMQEFPRMLYRKTDKEERVEQTDKNAKCGETWIVINRYDGLLCDTLTAHSATEAEALAEDGWDVTPQAAHGLSSGLQAQTSAKDERIAELERMLAQQQASADSEGLLVDPIKRGPGRPPKLRDGA